MIHFRKHTIYTIACCALIVNACKKNQEPIDNAQPIIQQFTIEKKNNEALATDITFNIKGDSIIGTSVNVFSKKLKATFTTDAVSIVVAQQEQESGSTENDFSGVVTYKLKSANGVQKNYYAKVSWQLDSLPHIYINTENGAAITSKENYVNATIAIDGKGKYENYSGATQIKGRGNSTWSMPKKPYRIKLASKASLFGLSSERDWVLLANYLDPTLMLNAVAMKIGQQLNIPYTNHIIPVNVTLNGSYIGSYNFTEQVEVGSDRVAIGDDGLLLELDKYFDEAYKFHSQYYSLPVMIKAPDLSNNSEVDPVALQFNAMEALLNDAAFPNNTYKDHIDISSVAGFLIVYLLTDNEEPNHPKSTYMHKTVAGKFVMGPIWDFDWAYAYEGGSYFYSASRPLFWTSNNPLSSGTKFFTRFLKDPEFVVLLKQQWADYKLNSFNTLIKFVEDYATQIESAKNEDYKKWKTGDGSFMNDAGKLKNWLIQRVAYIDTYLQGL
ncbi:MAG: CotH kinase family protein [Agriterribacter sp.]